MIEVKLYPNRKLYANNKYISYVDLFNYFREGVDFKVIRKLDKSDATPYVLARMAGRLLSTKPQEDIKRIIRDNTTEESLLKLGIGSESTQGNGDDLTIEQGHQNSI